jgi:hypothetical protein
LADNAVVTPTGVASSQLDHQVLKLLSDPWTPAGAALLGPIELLGNQLSEPSQNRIWFGHAGNLRQGWAPEPFGDLGPCGLLAIRQQQASSDVCLQDAVLRHQVLILQQQFLVHQPGYIAQQPQPIRLHHSQNVPQNCRLLNNFEFLDLPGSIREPRKAIAPMHLKRSPSLTIGKLASLT